MTWEHPFNFFSLSDMKKKYKPKILNLNRIQKKRHVYMLLSMAELRYLEVLDLCGFVNL